MRLALSEIPNAHLEEFSELGDLDFALAHRVLEDEKYTEFYRAQSIKGREVILDNSFHELGHPLSPIEVKLAADKVKPACVISPDKLGEPKLNYDWFKEMLDTLKGQHPIGVVMSGRDSYERQQYFEAVRKADWLLFPYRENRLVWIQELLHHFDLSRWPDRIHFLGVSSLPEIKSCHNLCMEYGWTNAVYDTCKPLKWAYEGVKIHQGMNLRGNHRGNYVKPMTPEQQAIAYYNIAYMRRFA